jgi:hypothetical protein
LTSLQPRLYGASPSQPLGSPICKGLLKEPISALFQINVNDKFVMITALTWLPLREWVQQQSFSALLMQSDT